MQFFAFWTIIDYVLYVIKLSMKKVIIQFWQWILKHKKRLIYGALAFFVGQICFLNIWWIGIQNEVFAADNSSEKESTTQKAELDKIISEKISLLDFFKKTAYVLVYPMMFLAGKLVDNSLVYGEMFKFDIVLWDLWNMVRNLANFWLGFLFIYYIFRYIIKQDKDKGPKRIIKQSLIAGVWIQASWFLMAVLIDISTIMIYWIWGLPLSILWSGSSTTESTDSYVMKHIISVDANDISNTYFYLTNIPTESGKEQIYISQCDTFAIKDSDGFRGSDEYILGPKMIYYQDQSWKITPTMKNACNYYGNVYKFNPGIMDDLLAENNKINVWNEWNCTNIDRCKEVQSAYNVNKDNVKGKLRNGTAIPSGQVLKPWDTIKKDGRGWDEGNEWIGEGKTKKMSELMKSKDTKTYVWVFTTLYASLLDAWRWMLPDTDTSIYSQFLSCLLTLGHVLAIAIPLAAALLVLVMRIAIIWMAIVLSPIIVLLSAFGFMGGKWGQDEGLFGYLNLKSLIWIIFSPVVICFAVSMSTVLVRLIEKINFEEAIFKDEFEVLWLIRMNLSWFSVWLSRLIVWVMWIAISWFLVWMAVKYSKLWKSSIITSVEKFAKTSLWSVWFIPIPKKDWAWVDLVWANSFFWLNGQSSFLEKWRTNIKNKYEEADTKTLNQFLDPDKAAKDAENTRKQIQQEKNDKKFQWYSDFLFESAQIGKNWTSVSTTIWWESVTFNSLDDASKDKIIQKINDITNNDRKDEFGKTGTVKVWDKTYEYNEDKHKYE